MKALRYILLLLAVLPLSVRAQKYPERRLLRQGNRLYEKLRYEQSAARYAEAAERSDSSYAALFNLGDARYKQGDYPASEQLFARLAADTLAPPAERARTLYNLGNAQFQQRKLRQALESFRNSLRLNPSDMEAKFNYAYTKKLLEEEQNPDDENNQDQNQNDNQNQNPEQNPQNQGQQGESDKDPGDGEEERNDPGRGDDDREPQDAQGEGQPQPPALSDEQARQMLEAVQGEEDKTREKMNEKRAVGVGRSRKNW